MYENQLDGADPASCGESGWCSIEELAGRLISRPLGEQGAMSRDQKPWVSGPREILRHALDLLSQNTDAGRRIAMILIDNAVELTIRTYFSLPKRVTGITLSRKEVAEVSQSFPAMLDALEEHTPADLEGIDLGEVEWYHRLRNQLYHEGNGLTVDGERVRVYAELANVLFERLFGTELVPSSAPDTDRIGRFVHLWSIVERTILAVAEHESEPSRRPRSLHGALAVLETTGDLPPERLEQLWRLRDARNAVVHGHLDQSGSVSDELLADLEDLAEWTEQLGLRLC